MISRWILTKSNATGIANGAETAFPSGEPEFTHVYSDAPALAFYVVDHCLSIFLCLLHCLYFFVLRLLFIYLVSSNFNFFYM